MPTWPNDCDLIVKSLTLLQKGEGEKLPGATSRGVHVALRNRSLFFLAPQSGDLIEVRGVRLVSLHPFESEAVGRGSAAHRIFDQANAFLPHDLFEMA